MRFTKQKKSEQDKKPNMDCINLLTSILICYPEISIITFEPEAEEVHLNYTVNKSMSEAERTNLKNFFIDSMEAYYYLEGTEPQIIRISLTVHDKITFIDVERDVKTFSHGEIRLFSELLKEKFGDSVGDESDRVPLIDSSVLAQSELIDTMLGSIKINPVSEKMIGIREDGRVIVYNK